MGRSFFLIILGLIISYVALSAQEKVLFLIAGQSNALGVEGTGDKNLCNGLPCFEYDVLQDSFIPLEDPIGQAWRTLQKSGGGSVGSVFAAQYYKLTQSVVQLVSAARGGSSCHDKAKLLNYDTWSENGNMFDAAVEKTKCAINKSGVPLTGIIWIQGERDANAILDQQMSPEEYGVSLEDLIARFRKAFGLHIPIYIVKTGFQKDRSRRGSLEVRNMQEKIANSVEQTHIAFDETDLFIERKLYQDHVHCNQNGLNEIGHQVAKYIYNDLKNK